VPESESFPDLIEEKDKMSAKVAMAITLFLAATAAWAQNPGPAASPAAPPPVIAPDPNTNARVMSKFGRNRRAGAAQTQLAPPERLQEMESTLNDMHALLKQMQAKNASSRSKDPVAKANLEMWELLLAHLDKEFHQLQVATVAREEVEARRASLYNQAYEKAAKEARAAAAAGQTPPAPSTSAAPKPNPPKE
jgi:hypothetical protein